MNRINFFFTAKHFHQANNNYDIMICIDILRASSTVISILDSGCEMIVPAKDTETASQYSSNPLFAKYLLIGEKNSVAPTNFDYSNSPSVISKVDLSNRKVIFASTNGAKVFLQYNKAKNCIIASYNNISQVVNFVVELAKVKDVSIAVVCSGTDNLLSTEDLLFGGELCYSLSNKLDISVLDKYSKVSADYYLFWFKKEKLESKYLSSFHAKRLINLGLTDDVKYCFLRDISQTIPIVASGIIS